MCVCVGGQIIVSALQSAHYTVFMLYAYNTIMYMQTCSRTTWTMFCLVVIIAALSASVVFMFYWGLMSKYNVTKFWGVDLEASVSH